MPFGRMRSGVAAIGRRLSGCYNVRSAKGIITAAAPHPFPPGVWRHMSDPIEPIVEILVPMDFSACSKNALRYAMRIAAPSNARLHLLYVDDDPGLIQPTTAKEVRDEFEDRMAMRFLDVMTAEERDRFRTVMAVRCGTAYHEIEKYAQELGIDLIVLGSVGRSAIADAFLGSVAHHVMRKACCPVVAVRQTHA